VNNLMDSFFNLDPTAPSNEYNVTLILTKTVHHTATSTVSEIVTMTATSIVASSATPNVTAFKIPHFPKVDTAFTAIFGSCCLFLLVGILLRNKKRKIKGFNIPLFLGSLCIPSQYPVNGSQRAWTLSLCRLQFHQQEIRARSSRPHYSHAGPDLLQSCFVQLAPQNSQSCNGTVRNHLQLPRRLSDPILYDCSLWRWSSPFFHRREMG